MSSKKRKPFFRQLFVCTGVWTLNFMYGLCLGAPTVMIPQIRKENNSTDVVTIKMESWIASASGYSALPNVIILCAIVYVFGRKRTCLLIAFTSLLGFIFFCYSSTLEHIIISQIIQGTLAAAQVTITIMCVTEYTSPEYRSVFLPVKTASAFWGVWVANALGTFFHWKSIALVGISSSLYSMATIFIWPESPYWLSYKGKIEDCTKAHRWLKGSDEDSEKELYNLVKYNSNNEIDSKIKIIDKIRLLFKTISQQEVYKPVSLCMLAIAIYHLTGKFVYTVYSIQMLKKITENESAAYIGMLILDGVSILGMYCGCLLSKYVRRRVLLFSTSAVAICLLFTMALYLYLTKLSVLTEDVYLSISLLAGFSLAVCIGPMILSATFFGELVPLKSRSVCLCVLAFYAKLIAATTLQMAPYLLKSIDVHGTFLMFAITSSIVVIVAYIYFPETRNKTLIEISEIFDAEHSKSYKEVTELMILKKSDL